MTSEEEKRLILLLTIIGLGGSGSKSQILNEIERADLMKLSPHDLEICSSRNELKWRNDLAYIRSHLVNEGYLSSMNWNNWSITETGRYYFYSLVLRLATLRQVVHINVAVASTLAALVSGKLLSDYRRQL